MQQGLVLSPAVAPRDVAIIVGVVVLMALLASLQPAWKASRMDPVRALAHV
jgi:putative ABC transport system permease protein